MSGAMTHPHHHHHINWYLVVVLLVVIAILGGILVEPYITTPEPAIIPVTGDQNAYAEYLRGEKYIYAMPVMVGEALMAYHQGEKVIPVKLIQPSEALTIQHLGEKTVMDNIEFALLMYRIGEKDY